MTSKEAPPWLRTDIASYIAAHSTPPDTALTNLIERTREVTGSAAVMQVSADQGALLTLLTGLTGTKRALEIGTFTGYSSICIARGLQDGGHLLCCDVSEEYTSLARQAWAEAGVNDRIELRVAPALETLEALPTDTMFDLVFIDADKVNYLRYYEAVLPHVRPDGLIMADNTLWSGNVTATDAESGSSLAIMQHFVAGDHAALQRHRRGRPSGRELHPARRRRSHPGAQTLTPADPADRWAAAGRFGPGGAHRFGDG